MSNLKTLEAPSSTRRFAVKALAAAVLAAAAGTAQADPRWSAVGATGTVDPDDYGIVDFSPVTGVASVVTGATGTVNLRYQVMPVGNLDGSNALMTMRFNAPSDRAQGRVRLTLREVSLTGGLPSTVVTLDSPNAPVSNGVKTLSATSCHFLDFDRYAYFVDAEITRVTTGAVVTLNTVDIRPGFFCQG